MIGLIIAVVMGAKILTVPFLIVLGLAAGQYGFIEAVYKGLRSLRTLWLLSLLGTVIGIGVMWWAAPSEPMPTFLYEAVGVETPSDVKAALNVAHIGLVIGPIVSAFYLLSLLMLQRSSLGARILQPLQAYGRMALTNYIGQTVLLVGVQYLFLNNTASTYLISTLVSLAIVIVQIIFSNLWMKRFRYGPFEWVWRCGTYWRVRL